jgi:NAD(P)-dependent dehydrogenase (short-subunit alcohol dehydrogenase family)
MDSDTARWTPELIPDLTGRRALVTGVTSGLGEVLVATLARRGAEVVMAARNVQKLTAAVEDLHRAVPAATVMPLRLDLADQSCVRRAAQEAAAYGPLHLLVNNAGVMAPPYQRTVDGFELQMATNHLGHFALTGLLLPQLVASGDARVVSVSSEGHRMARSAPLGDPRRQQGAYRRWPVYGQTKLANLLFVLELDRRAREAGLPLKALAAHPGLSATGLMRSGHGGRRGRILDAAFMAAGQPPAMGALPILMAATADLAALGGCPRSSAPPGWRATTRPRVVCGTSRRPPPVSSTRSSPQPPRVTACQRRSPTTTP